MITNTLRKLREAEFFYGHLFERGGAQADGIDRVMIEPLENFETWLRIWTAKNLGSPGESTDPEDVWVRLRADELVEDATTAGFYGELVEAAKPYGELKATCEVNLATHLASGARPSRRRSSASSTSQATPSRRGRLRREGERRGAAQPMAASSQS